jgi:hypothetical protein
MAQPLLGQIKNKNEMKSREKREVDVAITLV